MTRVANNKIVGSKVEGKISQSAECRLSIFPTKNMTRIIAAADGLRNAFANGGESG